MNKFTIWNCTCSLGGSAGAKGKKQRNLDGYKNRYHRVKGLVLLGQYIREGSMGYYSDRDEIAKELGVPPSTVDFWRRRKDQPLPSKKIGKHVRYILPEVKQWINLQNGQTC